MMQSRSYRVAFIAAIMLHVSMVVLLLSEPSHERPVLTMESKNEPGQQLEQVAKPQEEAIKAVSMDNKEVMEAVNRLKQERLHQQQAENNRQRALAQQAELARKQRIEEQQRVEKLKSEAAKLAIAHQKQLAEEQQHLKQLAQQKIEQEKHLADMKKQQQELQKQQVQEAQKLADAKKKADDLARAEQVRVAAEKAKAEMAQKQQAAAQQAAVDAANRARIAGEVDKYKALIINAISRQWILPENADSSMSSQFRIRLAPNGAVLEVSLTRSSGDPILDRSAQAAIYKASPLPVPSDATTFNLFRDISLTVRPVNARG